MPTKDDNKEVKSSLMPKEEALNILQLNSQFTKQEVEDRFNKLFNLNDPVKGGSYYIQCKVMGAKLSLLKIIDDIENPGKKETEENEDKSEEKKEDEGKPEEKGEKKQEN